MSLITPSIPAECITAFNVTYHPIYRSAQWFQAIVLTIAIFPLSYFIKYDLLRSPFHGNLKWTFFGYFGSVLLFSTCFAILAMFQVVNPLISNDYCDLIIDRDIYKIGNICSAFFMALAIIFPMAITVERFYATKNAESYERMKIALGPFLCAISILSDILIVYLIYKDDDFSYKSISFVLFPPGIANEIYRVFWILLGLNILNFIFNCWLLRQNTKLKKINSTLTAKYQLEEVYQSTRFAASVIFIHVLFFGIYVTAAIVARSFGEGVFADPITFSAVRGTAITLIAIYNFVVGVATVYMHKKILKSKKSNSIHMQATGSEGAQNYDTAMFNIWNSVSQPITADTRF